MTIACPAKINLTLEVLSRREDGYHGLRSVMVPLELADELHVEASERFAFSCSDPSLAGEENLVARAARALDPQPRLAIRLEKRIPVQAGLGGGSSDAAGVLRAAMAGAFGTSAEHDWMAIARSLGSDVPFFLAETAALVEGTGERVTAAGAIPRWSVLVVKPPAAVSTAAAYAMLDEHPRASRTRSESVSIASLAALQRGDFDAVCARLSNDFHDVIAASSPPIARALSALTLAGAARPLLCGSGSAVFALERDAQAVATLDDRLDLPPEYARFRTAFAATPAWRGVLA